MIYHITRFTLLIGILTVLWIPQCWAETLSPSPAPSLPSWLLPTESSATALLKQPRPQPRTTPEPPWLIRALGAIAYYTAEYNTKVQLDDGRPPLPNKTYPNYFYPSPTMQPFPPQGVQEHP